MKLNSIRIERAGKSDTRGQETVRKACVPKAAKRASDGNQAGGQAIRRDETTMQIRPERRERNQNPDQIRVLQTVAIQNQHADNSNKRVNTCGRAR